MVGMPGTPPQLQAISWEEKIMASPRTMSSSQSSWVAPVSRRRYVRLPAPAGLQVRLVASGVALAATDICEGGLGARSAIRIPVDSVHALQLMLGRNCTVTIRAQVVDCHEWQGAYRLGLKFLGRPAPGSSSVEQLMDRLTSSMLMIV